MNFTSNYVFFPSQNFYDEDIYVKRIILSLIGCKR